MIENFLPHLYDFYLVAQSKSFTKAAQTLRVSQSAISFQIKTLEDKLQMQLFDRQSKKTILLTESGKKLFQTCEEIFPKLQDRFHFLKKNRVEGRILVTASLVYGTKILIPFIKKFHKKYPNLTVETHFSDDVFDLRDQKIDFAIRWQDFSDKTLDYVFLAEHKLFPVASKVYLRQHSQIKTVKDLENQTLILKNHNGSHWQLFLKSLKTKVKPKLNNHHVFTNTLARLAAVQNHLGIAILPDYLIREKTIQSRVKIILPQHKIKAQTVNICFAKQKYMPKKHTIFIEELKSFLDGFNF